MDLSITVLLGLIGFVAFILIILILFEGRTNKKISRLYKEIKTLQKNIDTHNKKLNRLSRIITSKDKDINEAYIRHSGHIIDTFQDPRKKKPTFNKKTQSSRPIKRLIKNIRNIPCVRYINEKNFVSYIIALSGIIILGLGITFFIKFTLEEELINAIGKVMIGIAGSAVLIISGHLLRKRFIFLSSILLGGGMAILYYSFAIGYYQYNLFNEFATLLLMIVTTVFSILLSITYNRRELAYLAIIAAFTAPFIVDFTPENYIRLFNYILVIDIGMIFIAYHRKWVLLSLVTHLFTAIFYALWLINTLRSGGNIPFPGAFIYLTGFYFIFFIIHTIYNIREGKKFLPIELTFVIFNTIVYYSASIIIFKEVAPNLQGIFTAFLSILNFLYLIVLHRRTYGHSTLKFTVFALALIFLVLVPPVEFVGKSITLVWAFQLVLLLWLAQRIDVKLMRLGSAIVIFLLLINMGVEMWNTYINVSSFDMRPVFYNLGFISNITAVIALLLNVFLLRYEPREYYLPFITVKTYRSILIFIAVVVLYFSVFFEIRYYFLHHIENENVIHLYIGLFNVFYLFLLSIAGLIIRSRATHLISLITGLAAFLLYFTYYQYIFIEVRNDYLLGNMVDYLQYRAHYGGVFLLFMTLATTYQNSMSLIRKLKYKRIPLWIGFAIAVFLISSEADHVYILNKFQTGINPSAIANEVHKMAYTLLWTVIAFISSLYSIIRNKKSVKELSFTFFIVIILKLLFYDLAYINNKQQILSFLALGGALLIIAFIYHISSLRKKYYN